MYMTHDTHTLSLCVFVLTSFLDPKLSFPHSPQLHCPFLNPLVGLGAEHLLQADRLGKHEFRHLSQSQF